MCWCILIPVLVGLICGLLGYLLGKLLSKNDDEINTLRSQVGSITADRDKHLAFAGTLQNDVNSWKLKYDALVLENDKLKANIGQVSQDDTTDKLKIQQLSAELDACKSKNNDLSATISNLEGNINTLKLAAITPVEIPFDAAAASAVYGKKIAHNDLKIVEGIGPKIEELFQAAGVKTWKALADTSVERCQEILATGGDKFQIHNPGTWPKQSLLAYEGKWQELKTWQDVLDGGKE